MFLRKVPTDRTKVMAIAVGDVMIYVGRDPKGRSAIVVGVEAPQGVLITAETRPYNSEKQKPLPDDRKS